jgi:hypothetical protein
LPVVFCWPSWHDYYGCAGRFVWNILPDAPGTMVQNRDFFKHISGLARHADIALTSWIGVLMLPNLHPLFFPAGPVCR